MDIVRLLQILKIKAIIINHSSILYWFYSDKTETFKNLYVYYKNFKLVLNLISIEGSYLYREWGINNSITFTNLMPFNINKIKPSDLSSKNIIMFGRASDNLKNFDLDIKAMKYFAQKIPDVKLFIVSSGKLNNLKQWLKI